MVLLGAYWEQENVRKPVRSFTMKDLMAGSFNAIAFYLDIAGTSRHLAHPNRRISLTDSKW
jgi:hypothetical protein